MAYVAVNIIGDAHLQIRPNGMQGSRLRAHSAYWICGGSPIAGTILPATPDKLLLWYYVEYSIIRVICSTSAI